MEQHVPHALLDLAVIEEVSLDTWKDIFEEIGYPVGLARRTLTHDQIEKHLAGGSRVPDLVEILQAIHDLGSEAGREVLLEAEGAATGRRSRR